MTPPERDRQPPAWLALMAVALALAAPLFLVPATTSWWAWLLISLVALGFLLALLFYPLWLALDFARTILCRRHALRRERVAEPD